MQVSRLLARGFETLRRIMVKLIKTIRAMALVIIAVTRSLGRGTMSATVVSLGK